MPMSNHNNVKLVTHLVKLVIPDPDPLPENVPLVLAMTIVTTDNSVILIVLYVCMKPLCVKEKVMSVNLVLPTVKPVTPEPT